ncbi:hypothetical protein CONLIGDRAFT_637855 [Coniochaeta ligniaria NRRL 30616]|uniref:EDC4-like protein pdc1 beta-propeller domain-containing protein n=1 Tax=Coniochaeta ligniaria NRRL 30616 TaxID=1408157 RepID=A0A1J7I651_9PEZI|nr:hypothetical protein CONLIGDRAFT_637855 [Coniochaeta ligniaria NRRL 30616]
MASGNAGANGSPGDIESNRNLESLLAQLRRQSGPDSPAPEPSSSHGYHQHGHGQPYYTQSSYNHSNADSPRLDNTYDSAMDSPAFPPAAPTPPVQGFVHSSFPPSLMNAIGGGARGVQADDRTAHLLNLLKFSGQSNNLPTALPPPREAPTNLPQPQHPQAVIHAPAPASADPTGLLAALMKGSLQQEAAKPEPPAPVSTWNAAEPPSDTQQYLLNLLNRPKPSQDDVSAVDETLHRAILTPESSQEHATSPPADTEFKASAGATPIPAGHLPTRASFDFEPSNVESPPPKFGSSPQAQPPSAGPKASIFNYTNPFEDLAASSPLHRTPKSSTTPGASKSAAANTQPVHILRKSDQVHSVLDQKRSSTDRSPLQSPEHTRRKIEQTASPLANNILDYLSQPPASANNAQDGDKANPTVAQAVSELAERADIEAQEALARAEEEQTQIKIAKDLDSMVQAKTDEEFDESAQHAAQAIQKELDKEKNQTVLESTLSPEIAKEVREIVEEAAAGSHGPVADSWESAEADEIIVIEEESTPVRVFNLPMKPWIAINIHEGVKENRPQFREEATLDIARLKKDFDQIDRNLVAASENYLTYGMSKHGGLRVIRQVDGLDAKLFTDTHDRVFNVAMSCTPPDQNVTPKEAIIGTGVSGAVYWVQLKNGEKEHLDDAHPEQYGFALPPISTQEGDTPGGVLKTRARASAAHPDYFAVGRGKSINIIWPSFIMAKNLFKPGHDRVVDTEKLSKQCSLKINTGKAGKDFTFSQDDTTVVSLDKSGRVKFWDVRDLTAVAEDSDPRNPMPARTSLEIKEPLMTLTSTPEGEKAWPTSVLLLDKLRPYQKNTALRYMIVGMKQNHTLQLWDLALGKPVQEVNLPHSKESDAVCSVMYHPSTGMIVVGHPTRNSIYFLHLSAPKYAIKNLSQVEYIQRLVAQDSSIPQPDSTAVISGIREYSLDNKGTLRSLDILCNPATSPEGEEQTLFELYAMQSKGVTCLFVKQAELGWTKDNKVIHPVDAIATGYVKIAKLVSPPSPQAAESHAVPPTEPSLPIRLATRNTVKDGLQKAPSAQGEERQAVEGASAAKAVPERKEEDTLIHPPVERAEKKSRKKKANANANAAPIAEREFLVAVNGAPGRSSPPPARPVRGAARESLQTASAGISSAELGTILATVGERIDTSLKERLRASLTELASQLNEQQVAREQTFQNKQVGLLQKVSDVLNDNTQAVLKNIVKNEFEQAIVPTVRDTVSKTVAEQLGLKFNKDIGQSVQRELQKALPTAVGQALMKPETTKSISDKVVQNLGSHIDEHLLSTLNSHLIPAFSTVAGQAVQRLGDDIHRQLSGEIGRLEEQHRNDTAKIDQLVAQTTHLSNMISTMAASQSQIQKEFLAMKQHMRERDAAPVAPLSGPSNHTGPIVSPNPPAHLSPQNQAVHGVGHGHGHSRGNDGVHPREMGAYNQQQVSHQGQQSQQLVFSPTSREQMHQRDPDVEIVDELMANGSYDEAMMRFLQSQDKEEEIFSQVIVKYDANFVTQLQPLLLLSVGATVSAKLDGRNVAEKLALTELVIYRFNQMLPGLDDQLREVTPNIMGLIKSRVEQLFLRVSRLAPNDPTLKMLTNMANVAGRIAENVQRSGGSRDSRY